MFFGPTLGRCLVRKMGFFSAVSLSFLASLGFFFLEVFRSCLFLFGAMNHHEAGEKHRTSLDSIGQQDWGELWEHDWDFGQ